MDSQGVIKTEEALKGILSVNLKPGKTLDEFCERNFANYDKERFEAVALRFNSDKKTEATLFALDRSQQKKTNGTSPAKKFKTDALPISDILAFIEEFNFTLAVGNHPFEETD